MNVGSKAPSARRLLAIAIFIGLPAALLSFSALNVLQVLDDNLTAAEKTMQIDALKRRLVKPAADGKPLDLAPIYLAGNTRTLASATLQQYVVSAISATTGRLIEAAPVDLSVSTDGSESTDVGLKVTLDIDNGGLLQLLYALETGLPLIDIDTLSIRRLPADAAGAGDQMLRVDLLIRGHWKQQAI